MAAFETTTPDSIAKVTNEGPASLVQMSQAMGDSVQAAFLKRMRYDYVWVNSAARTAQTGMTQSSRGYQLDTKTEYIYDNSNWRIALSYGEWTQGSAQSIPNVNETILTGLTLSASASTDSTFVNVNNSTGVITFINPGIYAMSLTIGITGSSGTVHYGSIRPDTTTTLPPISLSPFTAGATTVAVPFLRVPVANYQLWPIMYHSGGSGQTTAYVILRIGRLG